MIIEVLVALATGDVGNAAVKPRLRSALSNCEPLQIVGESAERYADTLRALRRDAHASALRADGGGDGLDDLHQEPAGVLDAAA